jgi:hypothetical protein
MQSDFQLLMISAMYENGGNTTHRFLDGHPQMWVYPFESQLGTRYVVDALSSTFPVKYRWPEFLTEAGAEEDYAAIIDEEAKVRSKTPKVSKFRHMPFDFSDRDRLAIFSEIMRFVPRSRGNNVAAFFRSTFDAWQDYRKSGQEKWYVGYSPIVVVDTEKILKDLPKAHVLHVVRNPWSAYADTKKRPMPLSMKHYMLGWTLNQYFALQFRKKYPERFHLLRLEDILTDPQQVLGILCRKLGLEESPSLAQPSWNGNQLEEVYPWGTLRKVSPEVNRATAEELDSQEREDIRALSGLYLEALDYTGYL